MKNNRRFCLFMTVILILASFPILSVSAASNLEDELNLNYASIKTPMGNIEFSHTIVKNTSQGFLMPYEVWIKTSWSSTNNVIDGSGFSPYNVEYSNKYTEKQKRQTIRLLQKFQISVYQEAKKHYKSKAITGGFYSSWYKYPNLELDLQTTKFLSWNNYTNDREYWYDTGDLLIKTDGFKWDASLDDYDFSKYFVKINAEEKLK